MNRVLTIVGIILIICGGMLFAETGVLIDFTKLIWDVELQNGGKKHSESMFDYSKTAGQRYTEEEKRYMLVSLALDEWEVDLASSSRSINTMRFSLTRQVQTRTLDEEGNFISVLGARVHFPKGSFNSWALIRPPFEIPAYQRPSRWDTDLEEVVDLSNEEIGQINDQAGLTSPDEPDYMTPTGKYDNMGILKNVATIKSISVTVYGTNFPHGLTLRLKNQYGEIQDIFMKNLQFDGWKTRIWPNPNYIRDVKNRETTIMPLYPRSTPYVKFVGFVVNRDASNIGEDFVVYFKDIKIIYDKAIVTFERDIDDEGTWHVLDQRERERRAAELNRVGSIQVLRYLEQKKQATMTFDESGAFVEDTEE